MKIGGTYRLHEIGAYQWTKLASEIGLHAEQVTTLVARMCSALPDHAATVLARTKKEGLKHSALAELARAIHNRARACARLF